MGDNLTTKVIKSHLVAGNMEPGKEIAITIDHTLTQDATGTMAYLQFAAMDIPRIKTELSVSYVDHNTLQNGFENADDHRFLQGMAAKYGAWFSRPGNGICHQVHLERFGIPGKTLIGSDSHTPTGGGLGMLAIGVGGLDVAVSMGGGPLYLAMPRVVNVRLHGQLAAWVSAKDVILEVLRLLTVKGGVGKVLEYGGDGVTGLSVPERATITNMGAETGATTSIFPSDEVTRDFLRRQGREACWVPLAADRDAGYDQVIDIDLAALEPLVAKPHLPDNVVRVGEIGALPVSQVMIGSCTNSSYLDLMRVAAVLKGKTVHPGVSLVIAPGSRQVFKLLSENGALTDLIAAGARILECACGPCVGVGQAPHSGAVSVRTSNRNFEGRSGTKDGQVYLASPETAAATAIRGVLTDPRTLGEFPVVSLPDTFEPDDGMIIAPPADSRAVRVVLGPNIQPVPVAKALAPSLKGPLLLKVGDNITTDHIMPAGSKVLPLRSNIPALARHSFEPVDPTFPDRAAAAGGGFIVGGENYGQGSSREHAALVPMYLGIQAVIAKSFARIHKDNLINFGIVPLIFRDPSDYDRVEQDDVLEIKDIVHTLPQGTELEVRNVTRNIGLKVQALMTSRQLAIILAGGLLNHTRRAQETGVSL